jgi:uncharacterized protein (TIGR00251 family)
VRLEVHVQPRAKRTEIAGWHGDAVKIRLTAPPVGGAANDALLAFLSDQIGVARSSVRIVAGRSGRRKQLCISGTTRTEVLRRLGLEAR